MSKVIDFFESKARLRGRDDEKISLGDLLKKATILKSQAPEINSKEVIIPLTLKQLETALSSRIADILIAKTGVDRENLFCVPYITDLFLRMAKNRETQSWRALDYIKEYEKQRDTNILKKGAEVCFLNYSFFIKKDEGQNNLYREVGSSLYLNFFKISRETLSYYMGKNFDLLGQVTNQSLRSFHKKA